MHDAAQSDRLPPQLLADPRFRAACADRRIGAVFQLAKTRGGIYPARIARLTNLATSRVTEIMSGGRVVSSMDVIERVADGLRIPGQMLGLADRLWELAAPVPDYRPAAVPETWEILDILTRSTASDATLLHLEAAVADAAFRYPSSSPIEAIPVMQRQLAAVHELLGRPQSLGSRRRCVQILTALSGLLGLAHLDAGDRAQSGSLFHMGQIAAGELTDGRGSGDDAALTAWLLTMQSIAEYSSSRIDRTAALLLRADQLAANAGPRRQAWIAANLGRACAARGDQRSALAALDRAAGLLTAAGPEVGGLDFFTAPRLDGLAGESHALLGDHDAAADLLTTALDRRDQADSKGRAILTFDLAECRIGQGDLDAACSLANAAMDIAAHNVIQPLILRARTIQASLAPWRGAGPVRELAVRVRESEERFVNA